MILLKKASAFLPPVGPVKDIDGNLYEILERVDKFENEDAGDVLVCHYKIKRSDRVVETPFVLMADELSDIHSLEALQDYVEAAWDTYLMILHSDFDGIRPEL